MTEDLKLFEGQRIRHIYDEEKEMYYFSVVDVVAILIEKDYQSARKYWNKLAQRLREEGSEQTVTNCHRLKLEAADGKKYNTDVADIKTIFRIIQSVPSKKAEPIKQWLAKVGGNIAKRAKEDFETRTGVKVVNSENFLPSNKKVKQIKQSDVE